MPNPTYIFDNAVDSLQHAIAFFLVRAESPTAIKHAVLAIHHSIELFLKERLARVNPLLLYKDIDRPISDDSPTVGLDQAVARLANLGLALGEGETRSLHELKRRRNRIEHHRFEPAANHEAHVGQAIEFLPDFLPAHLGVELRDLVDEEVTYARLAEAALSYRHRVDDGVRQGAATGWPVTACPSCRQDSLALDPKNIPFCYFCNAAMDVEKCDRCGRWVHSGELTLVALREVCSDCTQRGQLVPLSTLFPGYAGA